MPGRLDFDVNLGRPGGRRRENEPMRLLLLGDFSGTPAAERPALANRPTPRVDVDSLDDVMRRLAPRVRLPDGEIAIQQIDDFHPDRLFVTTTRFTAARQARANPSAAAASGDLTRLLGTPAKPSASPARTPGSIEALIHDIVAPHVTHDNAADTAARVAAVDAAIAGDMRALLHDPAFQSLESAWRGVHWLVSNLELDDALNLHLLDVTREELLADVDLNGDLAETGLYRALIDRSRSTPDGLRWSAMAGLFQFGPSDADVALLAALGLIASQAGCPFLAGADPALAGDDERRLAAWQALRRTAAAQWIGLAAPRVLLRQPYGRASDPVDGFAFEEIAGEPVHEELLWGQPSLALALLIGRAFTARGWDMEIGDERELTDLPAYSFVRAGERELQPCAERLLPEREITRMVQAGLIPIASHRGSNAAVVVRFQSIADPAAPLARA